MKPRWDTVSLGSVVTFLSGGTPRKSVSAYWNGHIPWVSSGEMTQRRIWDTELKVTEDGAENGTKLVPKDTVLVVVRGMSLAKEFRVAITCRAMTFNQDLKALRTSEKLTDGFLFYYLLSQRHRIRDSATEASHGTKKLETRVLEEWPILLPDIRTQGAIADILSAYDDLIENNRRRMALLEESARLLYREWFVHLRFPGHEHLPVKDGVPEGWERTTLGELVETNLASYPVEKLPENINYIDISSVKKGRITKKQLAAAEAPGRARRIVRDGDVIWSNVRPNLKAYAAILSPDENDVASTGFTVLTPTEIPFTFLYCSVTTDAFVTHLVNNATGAGYPAVRPPDFERAEILVPPSTILEIFHNSVEPFFRLVRKLEQESASLKNARDILLPRLMNGEIPV